MMMMIPEPWSNHESMSQERKDFYEFHGCLMEPWDGPASVAFTDGIRIGATLDRNGLRPSRYYVTKDDLVVMASEVGVLDIPPERILKKGRLQPGRMFLVDTGQGRIIGDDEIKQQIAAAAPYGQLAQGEPGRDRRPAQAAVGDRARSRDRAAPPGGVRLHDRGPARCWSRRWRIDGVEANGSMGTDTPLAVLSNRPQLLYNYFKQLFAQVTNPPVDAIREEIIMAVDTSIGPEGNLLEPTPASARQIGLPTPVLRNEELEKLRGLNGKNGSHGFKSITLPTLFDVADGRRGAASGHRGRCARRPARRSPTATTSSSCPTAGTTATRAPIPALLAIAAVQHHLLREGSRTRVGLVVESGEPREVHHFALLLGYGASAINPYLAFESLARHDRAGAARAATPRRPSRSTSRRSARGSSRSARRWGSRPSRATTAPRCSRPSASTRRSSTSTSPGRRRASAASASTRSRARSASATTRAFPERPLPTDSLDPGGQYQYRRNGEFHLFNPVSIHKLQHACRTGDYGVFKEYSRLIDDQSKNLCTLRGLMELEVRAGRRCRSTRSSRSRRS